MANEPSGDTTAPHPALLALARLLGRLAARDAFESWKEEHTDGWPDDPT